jgi:hypothetical protein
MNLIPKTFFLVCFFILTSCNEKNATTTAIINNIDSAASDTITKQRFKPINPVNYDELLKTPVFKGKIAKNKDVLESKAVFSMNVDKKQHRALPLRMPFLVNTKSDTFRDTLMVIVQCEYVLGDTLIGVRDGWNNFKILHISNVICATFLTPIPQDAFDNPLKSAL